MLRRAFNAFLRLVIACARERRGQVALTFGLSALPALIMVGSAIDYSRAVTQRSNLQQATDSTVLAMAHTYLTASATCTSLYGPTQTYLTGTMNTPAAAGLAQASLATACAGAGAITITGATGVATLQSIIISQNNTQMCIKTTMTIATQMMTIVNIPTMTVGAYSCSQVGGTYEVAMVLDNSFSMSESLGSQTKMQALQQAASDLVTALFPSQTAPPTAAISIVPFNALVNVGTTVAGVSPPAFVDSTGDSSLNWRIIKKPTWATSRLDVFTALNVPWAGCVEDRPDNGNIFYTGAPDTTNYLTADKSATTGDSLFVPYFAPDEPGQISNMQDNYDNSTVFLDNTYQDCDNYVVIAPAKIGAQGNCSSDKTQYQFTNSYIADNGFLSTYSNCTSTDWYNDATSLYYRGSGISLGCRYKGATATIGSQPLGISIGPNSNCSTKPITPLTTDINQLTAAIKAMAPTGLTNLATGFMWGWRTISGLPTTPFFPAGTSVTTPVPTGGKAPLHYGPPLGNGPPSNTKIIVFMTDGYSTWAPYILTQAPFTGSNFGINTPPTLGSAYESFGYMDENRLSDYSTTPPAAGATAANKGSGFVTTSTSFRAQMDNVMLEACTNAKAVGIIVYTVGFTTQQTPIDQEGINLLQSCASTPNDFYQASNGADLDIAFKQIANSITNLRLSQ